MYVKWFSFIANPVIGTCHYICTGSLPKCRLLKIGFIHNKKNKYNEFYGNQRKRYNLQHVLYIILYIRPFHGLHAGLVKWLWAQVARTISHQFGPIFLHNFHTGWGIVQALCFEIYHVPKSIWLRWGEEGDHISSSQKAVKLLWHQAWTILAVWAVAPSRRAVVSEQNSVSRSRTELFLGWMPWL